MNKRIYRTLAALQNAYALHGGSLRHVTTWAKNGPHDRTTRPRYECRFPKTGLVQFATLGDAEDALPVYASQALEARQAAQTATA